MLPPPKFFVLLMLFELVTNLVNSLPQTIKLGAFVDDPAEEFNLQVIVDRINLDTKILPKSKLILEFARIPLNSSFENAKTLCDQLLGGSIAIFDISRQNLAHMKSLCQKHDIPYISLKRQVPWQTYFNNDSSLNFVPQEEILAQAYKSLLENLEWDNYLLIYDSPQILFPYRSLLQGNYRKTKLILRRLPDKTRIWEFLRTMKENGIRRILVNCDRSNTEIFLTQALESGMMTRDYAYVVTTLDLQTFPDSKFQFTMANITGFRLANTEREEVKAIFEGSKGHTTLVESWRIPTVVILFYDAVKIFAKTLHTLDSTQQIHIRALKCNESETWGYGSTILNYIKMLPTDGLSGKIDFQNTPFRTNFILEIIHLSGTGFRKLGFWNSTLPTLITFQTPFPKAGQKSAEINTLTVAIPLSKPFLMQNSLAKVEGYALDLLDALGTKMNFNYDMKLVSPFLNSSTTQWDDVLDEVYRGEVDFGVGDFSITGSRLRKLEFIPFMHHGIAVVYVDVKFIETTLFSFLKPFAPEVWVAIGFSYILVYLLLQFDQRFNISKRRRKTEDDSVTKKDESRRSRPSNLIALSWTAFVTLMTSIYTAKLVTSFLIGEEALDVTSVHQLVNEGNTNFGCIKGSTTMNYLQDSANKLEKEIWKNIKTNAKMSLKSSLDEGMDEVVKARGKFAFLGESPTCEYSVRQSCGLVLLGNPLNTMSYGIALRKDSNLIEPIRQTMLELQDSSFFVNLKEKWWSQNEVECKKKVPEVKPLGKTYWVTILALPVIGCFLGICIHFWTYLRKHHGRGTPSFGQDLIFPQKPQVEPRENNSKNEIVSTSYLDLGINSYGFPRSQSRTNGDLLLETISS